MKLKRREMESKQLGKRRRKREISPAMRERSQVSGLWKKISYV